MLFWEVIFFLSTYWLLTVINRQRCSFRAPRQPRKPVTIVTPPATSNRLAAEREGKDTGREENSAWVKESHTPTPNKPHPPSWEWRQMACSTLAAAAWNDQRELPFAVGEQLKNGFVKTDIAASRGLLRWHQSWPIKCCLLTLSLTDCMVANLIVFAFGLARTSARKFHFMYWAMWNSLKSADR